MSSSVPPEARPSLAAWIADLLATPGLTALPDADAVRRHLVEDSLRAVELVRGFEGPIVDVGSGGGVPGIPLALALPEREVALLEATGRKCEFLLRHAPPNARVVHGRAEEQAKESFGVAVAKALAPPPVAAEWLLPLVREGGAAILWVGPSVDRAAVAQVALRLAGEVDSLERGLLVLRKVGPTPPGFPRRVGMARKRPLA